MTAKKVLVGLLTAGALGGAVIGYLVLSGEDIPLIGSPEPEPPAVCPLTGEVAPDPDLLDRPVLAVKVENIAQSRPQAGLNEADIVYEQPVEGGITRFIALYHCRDSERIGPVRSGRMVDADVLRQYGRPLFAFAGGVQQVFRSIRQADIVDLNFQVAEDLYVKDPNKAAPHDLFISTSSFHDFTDDGAPPEQMPLSFDELEQEEEPAEEPAGEGAEETPEGTETPGEQADEPADAVSRIHADFSPAADVVWRWNERRERWHRFHGDERHGLEQGAVFAHNVVVQIVNVVPGEIVDAAGNPSPEVDIVGTGEVYVFRDGRVIEGTWERDNRRDLTRLVDDLGEPITLAPGRTWVELFPNDRPFEWS